MKITHNNLNDAISEMELIVSKGQPFAKRNKENIMKTDRAYEYDINKLIPLAEKEAFKKRVVLGIRSESREGKFGFYNHCFFTQYFHQAMKRLAIEAGLRRF